ncbi:hypothetical protein H4219_003754 [Mycoemilia scoparia]|uniref:Uncharacterized protein n=1 Tax=Mycoemilia scoparia TaxID=417184 RepID=A0A9W7ZTU8_9FUNG|nr:hypothetical protein H4219_003754 [Mycoemilia scoparia]
MSIFNVWLLGLLIKCPIEHCPGKPGKCPDDTRGGIFADHTPHKGSPSRSRYYARICLGADAH